MPSRILVIDDDEKIRSFLRRALTYEGYAVEVAPDGTSGLQQALDHSPDLIILDILMPGINGFEVCRRLRSGGSQAILMLTAKDEVSDRVLGLDSGADDYLVKPFALEELLARTRALLRRHSPTEDHAVSRFADLTVDTDAREVTRGGRAISLSTKEFELLSLFIRNPRRVLTRDQIMEQVWGYDFEGESNVLEVYIGYLRQKLEAAGEPRLIHTVRGVGYILREE